MAAPLLRIYRPQPYGSSACGFRYEGPFSRFDHHADDHWRGIHYNAPSLSSCVVEVFGDTGLIEPLRSRLLAIANDHGMTMASSAF